MKKIILSAVFITTTGLYAQVKVGTNPTNFATDASFQVEGTAVSNQFIVLKNGNVGIGVIAPTAKMSITQNAGTTSDLFAAVIDNCGAPCGQSTARNIVLSNSNATNTAFASLDFVPASTSSGISGASIQGIDRDATNGYAGLSFLTRNSTNFAARLTIKASGNVGIGTTAPTAQFETTGTLKFTGAGTSGAGKVLTSDATGNATWQNTAANASNLYTIDGTIDNTRTVALGANDLLFTGTADLNLRGPKFSSWDNLVLNANSDGTALENEDLIMQIRGTEYMRVKDAGKVGIGTATPDARLQVTASDNEESLKLQSGSNANVIVSALSSGSTSSVIETTSGGSLYLMASLPGRVEILNTPTFSGLTSSNEDLIVCFDATGKMFKRTTESIAITNENTSTGFVNNGSIMSYGDRDSSTMARTTFIDNKATIYMPKPSLFTGLKLSFYSYGAGCDLTFGSESILTSNGVPVYTILSATTLRNAATQTALTTGTNFNASNNYTIFGAFNRFRTHTFFSDGTFWWPDK